MKTCERCGRPRYRVKGKLQGRRGLCWACLNRERRGNPPRKATYPKGVPCRFPLCGGLSQRLGCCWAHYLQIRRTDGRIERLEEKLRKLREVQAAGQALRESVGC